MNTPRPKSLAMLFLAGAFRTGGAVTYAAERAMGTPAQTRPADDRSARDAFARELQLRPEQQAVIDSIFGWRRAREREISAPLRPLLNAVRDSARILIFNTLDSTQDAAFRRMIERQQRTADSLAKARGDAK